MIKDSVIKFKAEKKLSAAILKTFQEAEKIMDGMTKEARRHKSDSKN